MGSTLDDSVEGSVSIGAGEELGFFFPSVVLKESRVSDGVDIDVLSGLMGGLLVERVMMGDVGSMGEIKIF